MLWIIREDYSEDIPFTEGCFDSLLIILKNAFLTKFLTLETDIDLQSENSKPVRKLLELAINMMDSGLDPISFRLLLEYEMVMIFTIHKVSKDEIMKCLLIKELIPLLITHNFSEFTSIALNFSTNAVHEEIVSFEDFIYSIFGRTQDEN